MKSLRAILFVEFCRYGRAPGLLFAFFVFLGALVFLPPFLLRSELEPLHLRALASVCFELGLFLVSLVAFAGVALSVRKDEEYGLLELYRLRPFSFFLYLFGKGLAGSLLALWLFVAVVAAHAIGVAGTVSRNGDLPDAKARLWVSGNAGNPGEAVMIAPGETGRWTLRVGEHNAGESFDLRFQTVSNMTAWGTRVEGVLTAELPDQSRRRIILLEHAADVKELELNRLPAGEVRVFFENRGDDTVRVPGEGVFLLWGDSGLMYNLCLAYSVPLVFAVMMSFLAASLSVWISFPVSLPLYLTIYLGSLIGAKALLLSNLLGDTGMVLAYRNLISVLTGLVSVELFDPVPYLTSGRLIPVSLVGVSAATGFLSCLFFLTVAWLAYLRLSRRGGVK